MSETPSMEQRLRHLCEEVGLSINETASVLLVKHLSLVIERNRKTNLTRITSPEEALVLHVVDSLLGVKAIAPLELPDSTRVVDVGTGAGYPGIPLAIVTGWRTLLIDSVGKKVSACSDFVHELGLEGLLRCEHLRSEELAVRDPQGFDLVTMRAVAQTGELLEYASPLLAKHGHVLVYKAQPNGDEMAAAARSAELTGMSLVSRETFELPEQRGTRTLLVYEKSGRAKLKLPRKLGEAHRLPLGR